MHAAHVLGHGLSSLAEVRRFIGPPLREAFAEILATRDSVRIEEAVRVYRERFGTLGLFENSVYPGVPEALAQLCQAGHGLCLVDQQGGRLCRAHHRHHFGLRSHVPRVYGAELSGERSTKAELIAHALERTVAHPRRRLHRSATASTRCPRRQGARPRGRSG